MVSYARDQLFIASVDYCFIKYLYKGHYSVLLDPGDHNGSTLDTDKYYRSVNSGSRPDRWHTKYILRAEYICTSQPVVRGYGSIPYADRVLLSLTVVTRNDCHLRETP